MLICLIYNSHVWLVQSRLHPSWKHATIGWLKWVRLCEAPRPPSDTYRSGWWCNKERKPFRQMPCPICSLGWCRGRRFSLPRCRWRCLLQSGWAHHQNELKHITQQIKPVDAQMLKVVVRDKVTAEAHTHCGFCWLSPEVQRQKVPESHPLLNQNMVT